MIKFYCPNCNQKLGVPDEYAGRRIRCNKCNTAAVVPQPAAPAQSQTPAAPARVAATDQREVDGKKPTGPVITPKPAPAPKPQPAPAAPKQPEPEILDLEMVSDNSAAAEDAKLKAIQEASRQRASKITFSRPKSNAPAAPSKAGQAAKSIGKIPLSLALSVVFMAAIITVWVIIGKVTGYEFFFLIILVPIAGAVGLTCMVEHRSIFLGMLAVILGLGGMLVGRAMIAKFVIMPMLAEDSEFQSSQEDLQKGIEESLTTLPEDPEIVKEISKDDELMVHIAAWDMMQEGKLNQETFDQMYSFVEYGQEQPEEMQETINSACDRAQIRLDDWSSKQRVDALTKYYTPMQQHCQQSIKPLGETVAQAVTFAYAFFLSFDFFDLFLFPAGLWGAFKIAAAIGGEE